MNYEKMIYAMKDCEQTSGQSVYEHGVSVYNYFQDLLQKKGEWRFPSWIEEHWENILLNIHDEEIVKDYLIHHDCGKPFCKVVENDKVHFPNHAEVSKKIFSELVNVQYNAKVVDLIGWDMVVHTASSLEIENYCKNVWSVKDAITLLISALCEIHSNAKIFGGLRSISFKSKFKQVERRGRQICNFYFKKEVAMEPTVVQSKYGYHPFNLETLKKLREINKYYHIRENLLVSIAYKLKKKEKNRFSYDRSSGTLVKTKWVRPDTPPVPNVKSIIDEGRKPKSDPNLVEPIRYTLNEIDSILESARNCYKK